MFAPQPVSDSNYNYTTRAFDRFRVSVYSFLLAIDYRYVHFKIQVSLTTRYSGTVTIKKNIIILVPWSLAFNFNIESICRHFVNRWFVVMISGVDHNFGLVFVEEDLRFASLQPLGAVPAPGSIIPESVLIGHYQTLIIVYIYEFNIIWNKNWDIIPFWLWNFLSTKSQVMTTS